MRQNQKHKIESKQKISFSLIGNKNQLGNQRRTEQLTNHGYKVIRLWESKIKNLQVEEFKELIQ